MKFFHVLVLAASVSAFTLDARHHKGKGKKAGAAAKTNATARAIDPAEEVVEHVARDFVELAERHHKGKGKKAGAAAKTNATARAADMADEAVEHVVRDIFELVERHHKGKGKKAGATAKNNATARAVDTEDHALEHVARDMAELSERHHKGRNAGNKNKTNTTAIATARYIDTEAKAPADLIGRAFVA